MAGSSWTWFLSQTELQTVRKALWESWQQLADFGFSTSFSACYLHTFLSSMGAHGLVYASTAQKSFVLTRRHGNIAIRAEIYRRIVF